MPQQHNNLMQLPPSRSSEMSCRAGDRAAYISWLSSSDAVVPTITTPAETFYLVIPEAGSSG